MRKSIIRTITATTIESANVSFEKGAPVLAVNKPIVANGIIPADKALKAVRKAYGSSAQVTDIKAVDAVYEISVEDFIKYAKKIEAPTPEQAEAGKKE
jgi:hypothetical protein